jgi:DNA-binding MarR family transcriptional regulator
MAKKEEQSLLTLMKEIKSLIDKCLKNKLNLGDYTVPQTMIIYNLAHHGIMKISELSEKMGLTNSTVSGIVDRLEDQGVVIRQRSTKDRRVVYVELTPEHRKKHQDMYNNLDKYFADILSDIPPSEMQSITKSLNILKNALASKLDNPN